MDEKLDPVLKKYREAGFDKNSYGYFNPNLDEYDPDYDPHNDPDFNDELKKDFDPVLKKYRESGFHKNMFGEYFNPWVDEYDPDYDPHNDPEFNDDLKKEKEDNSKENDDKENNGKEDDGKEDDGKEDPTGDTDNNGDSGKKDDNNKQNPEASDYATKLAEYKKLLDIYQDEWYTLYELQAQYENGEIEYAEYDKYAMYMVDRYKSIKNEYDKIYKLFEQEKIKPIKDETSQYAGLSDEEIARKLEELEEKRAEEWNYRAHQENGMEGHENDELDTIEEEIADLKQEQKDRKDRPYKNMSKEELEAELAKVNAEMDDLYHYGAHELNGLEDADGDKWAELNKKKKQLEEEISGRSNKENDVEEPEKPDQPMMIDKDKDKGGNPQPQPEPQPQTTAIAKSGLQIFREQFNQMPEIKDKHTASERFNNIGSYLFSGGATAIGGAIVALGALSLGPVGMAAVALGSSAVGVLGSAVTAPVLKKLTGQSKLEKQIEEQFLSMNPDEFDKMVQYLGEGKITQLKPNAVILNALNKAMLTRTNEKAEAFKAKIEQNDKKIAELRAEISTGSLSPEDIERKNEEIGVLQDEIEDIRERQAPKLEQEALAIRRGKDAVSAKYKGNLKTRLNIFAKRNSTTEEFSPAINEYADDEYNRDSAAAEGKHGKRVDWDKAMTTVLQKYTTTDRLGRQNGVFNFRGDDGVVHLTSDRPENSAKFAGRVLTLLGALGFTKGAQKWSQHQVDMEAANANQNINKANAERQDLQDAANKNYSQSTGQKAAEGIVSDTHSQGEYSQVVNSNSFKDQNYITGDNTSQIQTEDMSKLVGQGKFGSMADTFETMGQAKDLQAATTAQRLADEVGKAGHTVTNAGVDHTLGYSYDINAVDQAKATSQLYKIAADVFRKIPALTKIPNVVAAKVMGGFLAPIATTVTEFMHDRNEAKQQKAAEKVVDTKSNDVDRE